MTTKPTVTEVLPLVSEYYAKPGNSCGGSLHIVLEDPNYKDSDVAHCIEFARERGDTDGERLGEVLARMSQTQRRKLNRRNW